MAFFGSVLRDDFGPYSDVDVLVEFEPGHTPGLRFFDIEAELEHMLGTAREANALIRGKRRGQLRPTTGLDSRHGTARLR